MSPRNEVIGDCTLWLGDCRDVLPLVGRADAMISDPPYEIEAHTMGRRVKRRDSSGGPSDVMQAEILSFAPIEEGTRGFVAAWAAGNVVR